MKIYRNLLKIKDQLIYDTLEKGLKNNKPSIRVLATDSKHIAKIIEYIQLDNPFIYHLYSYNCISYSFGLYIDVQPQYKLSLEEKNIYDDKIIVLLKKIGDVIRGANEYEKIISIHDLLCRNIVYLDSGFEAHTLIGSVVNKRAVCEGIAKLFKYLCDLQDIQCIVVEGKAKSSANTQIYEEHAWNKVKIDNEWYNIDVTFDLTIGERDCVRHDYLFVTDKEISQSHFISAEYGQQFLCNNNKLNYYLMNKLIMKNQIAFIDYLKSEYNIGKRIFEIKIPSVHDKNSLQQSISNDVAKAIAGTFYIEIKINYELLVVGILIKDPIL